MKPKRFYFRSTSLFSAPLRCGAPVFIGFTVLISGLGAEAGDLLRGGAGGSNASGAPRPGAAGGASAATATTAARANAKDTLARTTRTLEAVRAMQNAARNAAINGANNLGPNPKNPAVRLPNVPNGLVGGGLQVNPGIATDPTKWAGAELPVETVSGGKTTVTIKQTGLQALLNWETFNVGKQTTVYFDQTAGGANAAQLVAFNQISDPSGNPTQILGSIRAEGQIYLLNRNGVIFGGSSQVNARGLTVSSLPINENLIGPGLLNNPDAQFLFSGLDIPAGKNGTAAFTPEKPLTADGMYGDVIVQKGAVLTSPSNAAKVGGRITLVAPNIINQGSILTPDGQTILAAGLQVGFAAHSGSDPTLRGLDVYIGAVTDPVAGLYAGNVTHDGLAEAQRGSIVIAGREINQLGLLESSTSVALNGRIDLLAHFNAINNPDYSSTNSASGSPFIYQDSGVVGLGEGSIIRILPDNDSEATTIGSELALRSQVNIAGRSVYLGRESTLLAPNALVDIRAGEWVFAGGNPIPRFAQSSGQVYLDLGALVDVSGSTDVSAPVSRNILSVDLRGAELADSPLQRTGLLRNATIDVDIRDQGVYQDKSWIGTPLADVSGFANLIQRTAGELTVAGGTVTISAGGSVVMREGSKIDVSGGFTRFEGGMVKTTQLVLDGRIVDIGKATPDVVYDRIFDSSFTQENVKFGVTRVFNPTLSPDGSHYEPTSVEGAAAGKLTITSPAMALDGNFLGKAFVGDRQRLTPPQAGSLTLSFFAKDKTYATLPNQAPTPPRITFRQDGAQTAVATFSLDANGDPLPLAEERTKDVFLAPDLLTSGGFGELTVNNDDGNILLPSGVTLEASGGTSITLAASNIAIDGSIIAPSGKLSFNSANISLEALNRLGSEASPVLPTALADRGGFFLGATGVINTAGSLVDDRNSTDQSQLPPLFLTGGTISINAFSTILSEGGRLDVSGGAVVDAQGAIKYGDGGSLSIAAGRDLNLAAVLGGRLSLGAALAGFSGAKAGSLSISAPAIQIGGSSANTSVTLLDADFFNQGGFGGFTLAGTGLASDVRSEFITGLLIAPDTRIRPVVSGWAASTAGGGFTLGRVTKEEGVRSPASLTFNASGGINVFAGEILGRGDVVLSEGASVQTDAGGKVLFNGDTVALLGSVVSPGGAISVTGATKFPSNDPNLLLPTVFIGQSALLSAAGRTVLTENPYGLRQGKVLAGGSISVGGNIVAESGALLDVSGTRGILDLPPSSKSLETVELNSTTGKTYVPVELHSDGGRITLTGARMLYSDATLIGRAGGVSAIGGSVTVSSGRFVELGAATNSAAANLIVRQNGFPLPAGFYSEEGGIAAADAAGSPVPGIGNFSVSTMESGGFDSLSLSGNLKFEGDVSIRVPGVLRISSGGVIYGDGKVNLEAGYVNLGQAFAAPALSTDAVVLFTQTDTAGTTTPYSFSPVHGTGDLRVKADLIDIGNLSLQGIGAAGFDAASGDIRGNGTLNLAGSLQFKAGQIYPTTAGSFDIFAFDHLSAGRTVAGSVSITSGSSGQLPLAAGGKLGVFASEIIQGGVLRAPLGVICLGWDGSGATPVNRIAGNTIASPVTARLTLAAGGVTSVSAVDPLTGKGIVIPYGMSLDGSKWIDPAGYDITVGGVTEKAVNLSATELVTEGNSTVDISGGGDLYAYRWISGNGGTKDVLSSTTSFAVIPSYLAKYAPYAPFNDNSALEGQTGYTNPSLKAGDQITLAASKGLPAGTYTLLPARYALLPGAFLITPQGGSAVNSTRVPEGTGIVSGYRSNGLNASRQGPTSISRFEVASSAVVRTRSEYQDLSANVFLKTAATEGEFTVPRLPMDAGYLSFSSTGGMTLRGGVISSAAKSGRGGVIDINSAADILINRSGTGGSGDGLVLSSDLLNSYGAESLLIGGIRSAGSEGSSVTVNTSDLTLDNAGGVLTGADIILASREKLTLAKDSAITGTGGSESIDTLFFGNEDVAGSGNGALVRVSGALTSEIMRSGVGESSAPDLTVMSGSRLTGGIVILDSTNATTLDPAARITATNVGLSSRRISIRLNNPGLLNADSGLVLSGAALDGIQSSAKGLALLSYSGIDIYGEGSIGTSGFESLSLQAASIRGFNTGGGSVSFSAKNLNIDNTANRAASDPLTTPLDGVIRFDADEVTFGVNSVRLDGFANGIFTANQRILVSDEGSFSTAGSLNLNTPLITAESAARHSIAAAGQLSVTRTAKSGGSSATGGLGAQLTLQGGTLSVNGDISLASGTLTLQATHGDLLIGDRAATILDLTGTETLFLDVTRYTDGGTINFKADAGNVLIGSLANLSVSARNGGGNAGEISVKSPLGSFKLEGSITGTAGSEGLKGGFSLDAAGIAGGSLASLDAILNAGSFTRSRDYRIRTGDVKIDGPVESRIYRVAADSGSITVTNAINASGITGGVIDLKANGSLVVANGALLNVAGIEFDAAGKGGSVTLEAGTQRNGTLDSTALLDLRLGSVIDLSVAAKTPDSEGLGKFSGTLHLRAPRDEANEDIQVAAIGSAINGASSIMVEGVKLYGVTGAGSITEDLKTKIRNESGAIYGYSGDTSAFYTAMEDRLTSINSGLDLILAPGVEIYNLDGNVSLGTVGSLPERDWNLASSRFGPKGAPGILTLRASRNLVFYNALSDGFSGGESLWLSPLSEFNPELPANSQSWSFRLTAGADFSAASYRAVKPLESLGTTSGSLLLGKNAGSATVQDGGEALTSSLVGNLYQVIRTGSGDIDINAGRNVRLLNPFASIYTAGTQVADPTKVLNADDFIVPIVDKVVQQGNLGSAQQVYPAQYSMAGGNLTITAGENIERKTLNNSGLIDDSSRQLPNNWLYRRSLVDADGSYGKIAIGTGFTTVSDAAASTTWWIDFSNFFQGVGALGGGNVSLTAGRNVKNVDAVIPTNARAAKGTPDLGSVLELGGGDLSVKSGNDINGGVYYVERGHGILEAGGDVTTNSTRSPSFGLVGNLNEPDAATLDPLTWLPTTLFIGKSSFDVTAAGDLLLGPVSNPFLLPQGINNRFWYKTYFSTIAPDSKVTATSLGGGVSYLNAVTLPGQNQAQPMLRAWHETQLLFTGSVSSTAYLQPWLRLAETKLDPFTEIWSLSAPGLYLTSLSGDLNLTGDLTLFPSPSGQLEVIAAGSISGLQPTGFSNLLVPGQQVQSWVSSTVNLSDADPRSVPSIVSPITNLSSDSSKGAVISNSTGTDFMNEVSALFAESGAVTGANAVLQNQQARHTPGGLHTGDSEPLRIYALDGYISGLTLYSPKKARISADLDLMDISLYIQNLASADVSVVTAGRNIIPSNESSGLRIDALSSGNALSFGQAALAGDIQISGPGTAQVLAGQDLDLGLGANLDDGTGTGLTSIGNLRNPYLPVKGADLVVAAGIGSASSLASSQLAVEPFISKFVETADGKAYLDEIAPGVDFATQSEEKRALLAIEVFYQILRDTGRDFNDPESKGYQKYDNGIAAIKTLFPESIQWNGEILSQGRDIRTRSGGNISILAPGGGLKMAETTIGNPLTPPGIITESGGKVSLFTKQSVNIGIGRIFTLRGGDVVIWSSKGDIAAGSSSRTVQSAPPTRVVVDPQSASVETDLAGLATGGGIGVLATVEGVSPGDVDLIAPTGSIDAGEAGIRVTGNINLAAVTVLNASNISAGGSTSGTPSTSVSAPSVSTITSAANTGAASTSTMANSETKQTASEVKAVEEESLSIFTVDVIGYGGDADEEDKEEPSEDASQ
ncbi:MAG: hypothetical protein RLZZ214_2162 [Verrucomicrobiota bacterium]